MLSVGVHSSVARVRVGGALNAAESRGAIDQGRIKSVHNLRYITLERTRMKGCPVQSRRREEKPLTVLFRSTQFTVDTSRVLM